jgi:hypothetical protein
MHDIWKMTNRQHPKDIKQGAWITLYRISILILGWDEEMIGRCFFTTHRYPL